MKKTEQFDFSRTRRVAPFETAMFRKAIKDIFHVKRARRGRPPKVLAWARAQAKRRGCGYQTFINETLLRHAVR
jgi:hypothetical protein